MEKGLKRGFLKEMIPITSRSYPDEDGKRKQDGQLFLSTPVIFFQNTISGRSTRLPYPQTDKPPPLSNNLFMHSPRIHFLSTYSMYSRTVELKCEKDTITTFSEQLVF